MHQSIFPRGLCMDYEKDGEVIGGEWRQNGGDNFETLVANGMNRRRNASQVRNVFSEYVLVEFLGSGRFFQYRH